MTGIVDLYAPSPVSPALQRLRQLSRPFEIGFAVLAIAAVAFAATVILAGLIPNPFVRMGAKGTYIVFSGVKPGTVAVTDLALQTRAAGMLALSAVFGSIAAAFWNFKQLFGGYRRGDVFSEQSVVSMRRAGACLIVFAVAPAATQPLLRAAGSLDHAWFHGHSVAALIIGAALFVFAAVFRLGQEIERDAQGYV